jgi:hypothetical protein
MKSRQIIAFLISALFRISGAFPANGDLDYEFRANAELICYECARTPDNDTCAFNLKNIPEVTAVGQVRTHDLLILRLVEGDSFDSEYENRRAFAFELVGIYRLGFLVAREQ